MITRLAWSSCRSKGYGAVWQRLSLTFGLALLAFSGALWGQPAAPQPAAPQPAAPQPAAPQPAAPQPAAPHAATPSSKALPSEAPMQDPNGTIDILFYGSSFTFYNDMPATLRRLAAAAEPPFPVTDTLIARPGYSLDLHWRDEQVQGHLKEKAWDVVILQEQAQAPLRQKQRMATYAGEFSRAVEAIGGRTVLLMAWAPRRRQAMTEPLAAATEEVGQQVGAEVAPVGRAWQRALEEQPGLGLHSADGTHPAPLGSYFTACVLLTHLFETFDPRGLPALDLEVSAEDLATVQRLAWEMRHGTVDG